MASMKKTLTSAYRDGSAAALSWLSGNDYDSDHSKAIADAIRSISTLRMLVTLTGATRAAETVGEDFARGFGETVASGLGAFMASGDERATKSADGDHISVMMQSLGEILDGSLGDRVAERAERAVVGVLTRGGMPIIAFPCGAMAFVAMPEDVTISMN